MREKTDEMMWQVCPSCLAQNAPAAHFCGRCMAPLDSFASTDPMASIHSRMDTFSKASKQPANGVVLMGIWLIFGPMAMLGWGMVATGIYAIFDRADWGDIGAAILMILLMGGLGTIATILLWRTTANYIRSADAPGFEVGENYEAEEGKARERTE